MRAVIIAIDNELSSVRKKLHREEYIENFTSKEYYALLTKEVALLESKRNIVKAYSN